MLGGDIKIKWDAPNGQGQFALDASAVDLSTDEGLETAVVISLFTDKRAADDEELPSGVGSRRGWWGDSLADVTGDQIGSKLWLLCREKRVQDVRLRAEQYIREALQWMLDTKIATKIDLNVYFDRDTWLIFEGKIHRPGNPVNYRYNYNWQTQEAKINGV